MLGVGWLHCITRSRVTDIQWGMTLEVLRSPDCSLAGVCLLLRVRLWRCKQPGRLAVWVSGRKGAVYLCIIPAFIHLYLSQNITEWYLINRNVFLTVMGNPAWRRYQQNWCLEKEGCFLCKEQDERATSFGRDKHYVLVRVERTGSKNVLF